MKIGFVGSKGGMFFKQRESFEKLISYFRQQYNDLVLLHGDNRGADELAHAYAQKVGIPIEIYATDSPRFRAFCEGAREVYGPYPLLSNNKEIVTNCSILIAAPARFNENE